MKLVSLAAAGALGLLLATALPAGAAAPMSPDKAARSKECSSQADTKGLHGKARKRFRSACRRGKTPA